MEKLELDRKYFFILTLFLLVIFFIHLFFKYQDYRNFTSLKYQLVSAKILSIYTKVTKTGKKYTILKLKSSNGMKFFAINWQKRVPLKQNSYIKCKVDTRKLSFYGYLKGFFANVYAIKVLSDKENSKNSQLSSYIAPQHQNIQTKEIFSALFLATKIDKELRKKIQLLGISHLVAISGFHLGVLSFLIYLVLTPLYRFFQDKFFPYRNAKLDLMAVVASLLFAYLYIVDFIPSLSRAFVMLIVGYIFYIRHIKILSFETLFLTLLLLLSFYPSFIFSISFWFSISGVFYIFLFLHYFKNLNKLLIFILINFWVFILMQPIVHYIFPIFSLSQLFSPILSLFFIFFYPLELFLHLVKEGDLFDGAVLKLLSFHTTAMSVKTPLWFLLTYITTSLLSIYKKIFLYLLILQSLIFLTYLILTLNT